jgi:hypothetical protein
MMNLPNASNGYKIYILYSYYVTSYSSSSISYVSAKSTIISPWACKQVHNTPNVATCAYTKDGAETNYDNIR